MQMKTKIIETEVVDITGKLNEKYTKDLGKAISRLSKMPSIMFPNKEIYIDSLRLQQQTIIPISIVEIEYFNGEGSVTLDVSDFIINSLSDNKALEVLGKAHLTPTKERIPIEVAKDYEGYEAKWMVDKK